MNDTLTRSFGLVISLVLPGAVALFGIAFYAPPIREWFTIAATQPTSVGAFIFLLLASVGVGLVVGGVRYMLVDKVLFGRLLPTDLRNGRRPDPDHGRRRQDAHTEAVYQTFVAHHYQYYQFFSGMLVSLTALWLTWWTATAPPWTSVISAGLALLCAAAFLLVCAHSCLDAFERKVLQLLGPYQQDLHL